MSGKYLKRYQAEYSGRGMNKLEADPFKKFSTWFRAAAKTKIVEPNAMGLATVSKLGAPSLRMVLLKSFSRDGFVFFTNYSSRKGAEISSNRRVALLFYWDQLERQVRIEGRVVKVDPKESDQYFNLRPIGAQLAASISAQSKPLRSLAQLESRLQKLKREHRKVKRPENWGGYRVVPTYFEFWEGRPNRLHSRKAYKLSRGRWKNFLLQP